MSSSSRAPSVLSNTVLVLGITLLGLVFAELAMRKIDNNKLLSLKLEPASGKVRVGGDKLGKLGDVLKYLDVIPLAKGIEREWFMDNPPAWTRTRSDSKKYDEVMKKALNRGSTQSYLAGVLWNRHFLENTMCQSQNFRPVFARFPPNVWSFSVSSKDRDPHYRLPLSYKSGEFQTNSYGFRSPEIAFIKPAHTIRIAFAGASTTESSHGFSYTYPELVGNWLNLWAEANNVNVKFEVINAGRSGINSVGIRSVVESEIVPFKPDYVVYYEGSNEFWPTAKIIEDSKKFRAQLDIPKGRGEAALLTLERQQSVFGYSAIARRIGLMLEANPFSQGVEPAKPLQKVDWPDGFNPENPDLSINPLPVNLTRIINNLQDMNRRTKAQGARFIVSSFVWHVYDGMKLDPARDWNIYRYLNQTFWPFSYKVMEKSAKLQNSIFSKFARVNKLPFIDVASQFPKDPVLFTDAIHMSYSGVRLRAWIVFNQLLPTIISDIKVGRVPIPPSRQSATHPNFSDAEMYRIKCEKQLNRPK